MFVANYRKENEKKGTRRAKAAALGKVENTKSKNKLTFYPSGFLHHTGRAWVARYVHGGQLGVQAAIHGGSSVLFTAPTWDRIGLNVGIAFKWRR